MLLEISSGNRRSLHRGPSLTTGPLTRLQINDMSNKGICQTEEIGNQENSLTSNKLHNTLQITEGRHFIAVRTFRHSSLDWSSTTCFLTSKHICLPTRHSIVIYLAPSLGLEPCPAIAGTSLTSLRTSISPPFATLDLPPALRQHVSKACNLIPRVTQIVAHP